MINNRAILIMAALASSELILPTEYEIKAIYQSNQDFSQSAVTLKL